MSLAPYCLWWPNNVTSIKWQEYRVKGRDKTPQSNALAFQDRANGKDGEGKVSATVQHSECGLHLHNNTDVTAMRKHAEGKEPCRPSKQKQGLRMEGAQHQKSQSLVLSTTTNISQIKRQNLVSYLSLHAGATHPDGRSYTQRHQGSLWDQYSPPLPSLISIIHQENEGTSPSGH